MPKLNRVALARLAVVATCLTGLAACGSNSSSGSSGGSGSSGAADTATARKLIAPYSGQPSRFPVDTALPKSARGKRLAYVDCGTPVCALFYTLAAPAAKELGMSLTRIRANLTADSVRTAFDTVVSGKYDGVFLAAIQPSLWEKGLKELNAARVPVVTSGITGGDADRIAVMQASDKAIERAGQILAGYAVAQQGDKTDAVFYNTPEISFIPVMRDAFVKEVKRLCPGCKARSADLPAAQLTQAPATVVNDLQAHPSTTIAVFSTSEQTFGTAQAMKTAGIKIKTIANFPDPQTLQSVKRGDLGAALGIDLPVIAWTAMDSLARLATGGPAAPGAVADIPPMQLLTAKDLQGDVSRGWSGYPDFAARFTKLWKTTPDA